ncbi:L,D-transpeptidase family protein [Kitasatospora sp. NPDC057015]|uniref:L,D-transpeptidase family protein n=1 Tax=Kitasatospora sp. NPDC057015 TaxID=3346001 RepID=UPI003636210B
MSGSHRAQPLPHPGVTAAVPGARREPDPYQPAGAYPSYGQSQQPAQGQPHGAYDQGYQQQAYQQSSYQQQAYQQQAYPAHEAYPSSYQQPYADGYRQQYPAEPYGQQYPGYPADRSYEASASYGAPAPYQEPYQEYGTYGDAGVYEVSEPYEPGDEVYLRSGAEDGDDESYGSGGWFEPVTPDVPHRSRGVHEPADEPGPAVVARAVPGATAPGEPRSQGRRRKAKKKSHGGALTAGTALLLAAAAAGWYTVGPGTAAPAATSADGPGPDGPDAAAPAPDAAQPQSAAAPAAAHTGAPAADRSESRADGSLAAIPGLGAAFTARIPATTNQVVLASGKGKDTNETTVTVWSRTPEGRWLAGEAWAGHNAYKGWTTDHNEGDLRSPIGVFALTDAGGRKADPGSKLPYDKDANFVVSGKGFAGESLAGSFDYVVAINYNRVPGVTPLDPRRPDGGGKGGGIWIHVDHGGPTHGCISVPEDKMAQLLRLLDPAANPVIVMGDAASLAA